MSCGVGGRCGSDLVWLWCRPVATTPIRSLAWEPPYATGTALKRQKEQKKMKLRKQLQWSSGVAQQVKDPTLSLL